MKRVPVRSALIVVVMLMMLLVSFSVSVQAQPAFHSVWAECTI